MCAPRDSVTPSPGDLEGLFKEENLQDWARTYRQKEQSCIIYFSFLLISTYAITVDDHSHWEHCLLYLQKCARAFCSLKPVGLHSQSHPNLGCFSTCEMSSAAVSQTSCDHFADFKISSILQKFQWCHLSPSRGSCDVQRKLQFHT